jgi:hypothetical protein
LVAETYIIIKVATEFVKNMKKVCLNMEKEGEEQELVSQESS